MNPAVCRIVHKNNPQHAVRGPASVRRPASPAGRRPSCRAPPRRATCRSVAPGSVAPGAIATAASARSAAPSFSAAYCFAQKKCRGFGRSVIGRLRPAASRHAPPLCATRRRIAPRAAASRRGPPRRAAGRSSRRAPQRRAGRSSTARFRRRAASVGPRVFSHSILYGVCIENMARRRGMMPAASRRRAAATQSGPDSDAGGEERRPNDGAVWALERKKCTHRTQDTRHQINDPPSWVVRPP